MDHTYQNGPISGCQHSLQNNRNSNNDSRTNLLSRYQARSSWRWCSFVCAAVDCFRYGSNTASVNLNGNCENKYQQVFLQTYNLADDDIYQSQKDSNMNSTLMYQL